MLHASRCFLKVPSLLESSVLRLKSCPCRIVSMISSASTLVASTRFSWDSTEFCFTGCLKYQKYKHIQEIQDFTKRFFYEHILQEVLTHPHIYLLAVIPLWDGVVKCWGKGVQACVRDSLSSLGSGRLPIPVEALPTDKFLLWESSVRLEEREWPVL